MTKEETWKRLIELRAAKGNMPETRWDLRRAYLAWADLTEADLAWADLAWADLTEAKLAWADLTGVNLTGVNLTRARLTRARLIRADLTEADLTGVNLTEADLTGADLTEADLTDAKLARADLTEADLTEAKLARADLTEADLTDANLTWADLTGADLTGADLAGAKIIGAKLIGAYLAEVNLTWADLTWADLTGGNLTYARLVGCDLQRAKLNNCSIYGVSAWDLSLEGAEQSNLVITEEDEPAITVDNLKIAQFIHLLLNNPEIREVIDAMTSKVVLILGRFTPERKAVLDAIRTELRRRGFVPVLFDFEKPRSKDTTGTVETLARMARFIIADLTEPMSIPHELATIVPLLRTTPVLPLRLKDSPGYSMFEDLRAYPWVLPTYEYEDTDSVTQSLQQVIAPADEMAEELRKAP